MYEFENEFKAVHRSENTHLLLLAPPFGLAFKDIPLEIRKLTAQYNLDNLVILDEIHSYYKTDQPGGNSHMKQTGMLVVSMKSASRKDLKGSENNCEKNLNNLCRH